MISLLRIVFFAAISFVIFTCVASALADTNPIIAPKPVSTHPKHATRNFLIEASALGASKSWDFWTTTKCLDRGGWERDSWFGHRPSDKRLALENLGIFAAQAGFLWVAEHSRWKPLRWTGRAAAGYWTQEHIRLAIGNGAVCGPQTMGQEATFCHYWAKQKR